MTAYLYAIGPADGAIKIGFAKDVRSRLCAIQTGSPFLVTCHFMVQNDCAPALETEMHQHFAKQRLHGEWFDVPPALVRAELIKRGHTVIDTPFSATLLHARATKEPLTSGELASLLAGNCSPALFAKWRLSQGLNRTEAANAIGISRNMPQKYEDGLVGVPRTVALACFAIAEDIPPWPG